MGDKVASAPSFGLGQSVSEQQAVPHYWETQGMADLETLKAKLAKREGMPGFEENVREIKARIAELEKKA